MRRLRKLLTLSPTERAMLRRSLVVLAEVRWTLATRGLVAVEARVERARATIGRDELARPSRRGIREEARDVARVFHAAQRALPLRSTCLHLAAALRVLLAERGIASDLRIGVCKNLGKLTAHAWLECGDCVLVGGTNVYEQYAAFPRL